MIPSPAAFTAPPDRPHGTPVPRRPAHSAKPPLRRRERLAAIAAPVAAVILGAATPSRRSARLTTSGVILGTVITELAVALACRRRVRSQPGPRPLNATPAVRVVIPARDEAAVIGDLIADLGRQDLAGPPDRPAFTLTVVDDRSSDGTGEVVAAAVAAAGLTAVTTCLRRDHGADGKGAALAAVSVQGLPADAIVIVLDADARLEPDGLSRLVHAFDREAPGITAHRRMLAPNDGHRGWLARWQDDEQTVDAAIQRARMALGGSGEFRGNGMALRVDALRMLGGWDANALTEDLEATTRLVAATGTGVRWTEAEVWEQPALEARALIRQRLRWAEGAIRRDLRITWPVVLAGRLPARLRLDLAVYALQTLVPWLALGLLARADRPSARRRLGALGGAYLVGGAAIAAAALGRSGTRVTGVVAMSAIWPLVLPLAWIRVALSRGPLRFEKTRHAPGFSRRARSDVPATASRPLPRGNVRRPATIRRDGDATDRSRPPASASDGPRPGSAAPTSHRTCP
jgi:hypothetical protein